VEKRDFGLAAEGLTSSMGKKKEENCTPTQGRRWQNDISQNNSGPRELSRRRSPMGQESQPHHLRKRKYLIQSKQIAESYCKRTYRTDMMEGNGAKTNCYKHLCIGPKEKERPPVAENAPTVTQVNSKKVTRKERAPEEKNPDRIGGKESRPWSSAPEGRKLKSTLITKTSTGRQRGKRGRGWGGGLRL